MIPFIAGATSFDYTFDVVPGNYMIGASVDRNDDGEFTMSDEYYGAYGLINPEQGEICFPVYEGSSVADFVIQEADIPN